MSDFIEFQLPGGNKTVLSKKHIASVVYQNTDAFPNKLIIGIEGWAKPLLYEGTTALSWYEVLRDELGVDEVKPYSDPDTHEID